MCKYELSTYVKEMMSACVKKKSSLRERDGSSKKKKNSNSGSQNNRAKLEHRQAVTCLHIQLFEGADDPFKQLFLWFLCCFLFIFFSSHKINNQNRQKPGGYLNSYGLVPGVRDIVHKVRV